MSGEKYFQTHKGKIYLAVRVFLVLFLIFSIIFFFWNLMKYNEKMNEKAEKEEYIMELKSEVQRLKYMVDAPLDEEFKIRIAREKLGMCFPDEIIFYGDYEE